MNYSEAWLADRLKRSQPARAARSGGEKGRGVATRRGRKAKDAESEPRGRMNGLETRYVREILDPRKLVGEIVGYWFQPLRFRMAFNSNYTGDFIVQTPTGWELHEVKGKKWPAELLRFKVCAEMEPFCLLFKFYLCEYIDKRWAVKRVGG
jgi:hypothetical protein